MNDSERPHHPYSPSKLQSLEACPCFENRQNKIQHERTTAGTKAHAVAESGIDDNSLSDEDAAAAAECIDFVDGKRREMEDARQRAIQELAVSLDKVGSACGVAPNQPESESIINKKFPEVLEIKEEYLPIDDVVLPDGTKHTTAGYCDYALIDHTRTRAVMADWKYGRWYIVEARNNTQAIAYSLGLFRKFGSLQTIEFYFKQPLLDHVSHATFTRAQIPELYLRIQTIVARAVEARKKADFATAKPTVPVCNFCANLGRCPAVAALAIKVARKFHPLGVPDNITPTMMMNSRDTTDCLALASVCGVWAKAYKAQVTDRILRGDADIPPGQMIQTKSDREVSNPAKYKSIALRHITPGQYEDSCTVVFGKVEGFIRDAAPRGAKKAAIEEFNKELLDEGAVVKGQPYSFLKSISTKDEE